MKLIPTLKVAFTVGALVGGVIYGFKKAEKNRSKALNEKYDEKLKDAFSTSDAVASY